MKIVQHRPVYWECTVDGHKKFWAAQVIENKTKSTIVYTLIRKWGMIGTAGQKMEQTFNGLYDAQTALEKLIWEKESKGYKAIF